MTTEEQRAKALEALNDMMNLVESGECCCGDSMALHGNPMDAGHTPVDSGWYSAKEKYETIRLALTAPEHPKSNCEYSCSMDEGKYEKMCAELLAENKALKASLPKEQSAGEIVQALKIADARDDEVKELDFGNVFWACGILATALRAAMATVQEVTVEDVMDELGIAGTSGYNLIQMIAHAYPNGLKLSKAEGGE